MGQFSSTWEKQKIWWNLLTVTEGIAESIGDADNFILFADTECIFMTKNVNPWKAKLPNFSLAQEERRSVMNVCIQLRE